MEWAQFAAARALLARHLPQTRLVRAPSLENIPEQKTYLKLESELPTHSFKVRGAIYALSVHEQAGGVREVVASSTGNHGAAVAYAARLMGWRARIFLPEKCNPVKRSNIARLDAEIVEKGTLDLAGAFAAASEYAAKSGAFFLNDATDYVPMGDTALIRGVAAAAKHVSPRVKIIGVQSDRAPSYHLSWKNGRPIETETCDTIADGLATRTPVADNVKTIRELVDEVVLVSEEEMLRAIRQLLLSEHILAEPAGAAATAAFAKCANHSKKTVALLVTGANITEETLRAALATSKN